MHKQFPFVIIDIPYTCDVCHLAWQKHLPFTLSNNHSNAIFYLVHMDIWGPASIPSLHGHKYFLTAVDDFSRHVWLFLMKSKAEASALVKNFFLLIENQFHMSIKCIRIDNGLEFTLKSFYATWGVVHQTSCVATPQQNDVVERKHQELLNITRDLLFQANLPKVF